MAAAGVSKLGRVLPIFVPKGERLNGPSRKTLFGQQCLPQMSTMSHMAGHKEVPPPQQDNAPCHKTQEVLAPIKRRAKRVFPEWPPCSPDLSVLDFFYWSEIKRHMGEANEPAENEADRCTAVCLAAAEIKQGAINKAIDNFLVRCEKCGEAGGARFEHKL